MVIVSAEVCYSMLQVPRSMESTLIWLKSVTRNQTIGEMPLNVAIAGETSNENALDLLVILLVCTNFNFSLR